MIKAKDPKVEPTKGTGGEFILDVLIGSLTLTP